MTIDADLEMVLADLGGEFLNECAGNLDTIDNLINQISDRIGHHDHHVMDIKRVMRAVKIGARGYDFSALVHISHTFEDYIDLADAQSRIPVDDCRAFVDAMRFVILKRGQLNEKQTSNILEGLPLPGRSDGHRGVKIKGHIVFVIPKSVQQRTISRELASSGFRLTNANGIVQAIEYALDLKPDLIITEMEIEGGDGLELASALSGFSSLAHTRIAVLTSLDALQIEKTETPPNTTLLAKGSSFSAQLLSFIHSAGFT